MPVLEFYILNETQYVFFCVMLPLLGIIHVDDCVSSSFLSIAEEYFTAWIYHNLLIHSPVDGHLDEFQVLVIMNSSAMVCRCMSCVFISLV